MRDDGRDKWNYQDKVFINEINKAINLTDEYYEKATFREGIKTGFYDLQVLLITNWEGGREGGEGEERGGREGGMERGRGGREGGREGREGGEGGKGEGGRVRHNLSMHAISFFVCDQSLPSFAKTRNCEPHCI